MQIFEAQNLLRKGFKPAVGDIERRRRFHVELSRAHAVENFPTLLVHGGKTLPAMLFSPSSSFLFVRVGSFCTNWSLKKSNRAQRDDDEEHAPHTCSPPPPPNARNSAHARGGEDEERGKYQSIAHDTR